jgi:hypothetical protein
MGLPAVVLSVLDNGLAQQLPGNGSIEYVIGPGSQGPYYQLIQSTNPNDFVTQNGYGSGVELAGFICNSSGNEVAFVAIPVTGGVNTAVNATVPGGSTSVMTVSGTPYDNYYVVVTDIVAQTIGTAGGQITVSLDAGRTIYGTYNLPAATPSTVVIPNTGLTLSFAAGTVVVGDSWRFVSTEGLWTDAQIQSAINCMLPIPTLIPEDIIVAGGSALRNSTGTAGIQPSDVAVFDGYLTTLFAKKRFNRLLCAAGDAFYGGASTETEATWIASLQTAYASTVSTNGRVSVSAGHYNFVSPYSQAQFRRPLLWGAAARDSAVAIQVDLGRVKDGALANMPNSPPPKPDGYIYHDESVNPGLDASRFLTAMSFANRPGFYITNPNIMCSPGSDFNWLQHGHVIDAACLIAYNFFIEELSDSVRVNASGTILPQDAADLQKRANQALANGLTNQGAVSSATCTISLVDNILVTATLTTQIAIQPLGYLKSIIVPLTFVNVAAVSINNP